MRLWPQQKQKNYVPFSVPPADMLCWNKLVGEKKGQAYHHSRVQLPDGRYARYFEIPDNNDRWDNAKDISQKYIFLLQELSSYIQIPRLNCQLGYMEKCPGFNVPVLIIIAEEIAGRRITIDENCRPTESERQALYIHYSGLTKYLQDKLQSQELMMLDIFHIRQGLLCDDKFWMVDVGLESVTGIPINSASEIKDIIEDMTTTIKAIMVQDKELTASRDWEELLFLLDTLLIKERES